jgi:hypothetical protein
MANRKRHPRLRQRAERDVAVANQPALDALQAAQDSARQDYRSGDQQLQGIYQGLQNDLARQQPNFAKQAGQIANQFQEDSGAYSNMLGLSPEAAGLPAGDTESLAARALYGAMGQGTLGLISGDAQRNLNYGTSTQRQGSVDLAWARKNYLDDYNQVIDDISNQRIDVSRDAQGQIMARIDELRDSRKQIGLARSELEIRQQLANKDNRFRNKQFDYQKESDQATRDYALSEAELDLIKRIRHRLAPLKDESKGLGRELDELALDPTRYNAEAKQVIRRKRRVDTKITRKRKRINRIKQS